MGPHRLRGSSRTESSWYAQLLSQHARVSTLVLCVSIGMMLCCICFINCLSVHDIQIIVARCRFRANCRNLDNVHCLLDRPVIFHKPTKGHFRSYLFNSGFVVHREISFSYSNTKSRVRGDRIQKLYGIEVAYLDISYRYCLFKYMMASTHNHEPNKAVIGCCDSHAKSIELYDIYV